MKEIIWMGNSYQLLAEYPIPAKQVAGYQLHLVQTGKEPDGWKPMTTVGTGVKEIRIHVEGEYRILYIAKYELVNLTNTGHDYEYRTYHKIERQYI